MSVYTYKCPNCAASLYYNTNKSKLTCDYCHSEFTKEEIDKYLKDNPDKIEKTLEELDEEKKESKSTTNESQSIRGYNCNNCGAEVVTDDTTLTTFCYYCHSPVVITDRARGDFQPDKLIPFKYNRDDAVDKFLKWAKNKRYVPKSFYSDTQLEKITGLYLPYWTVNSKLNIDLEAKAYKTRINTSGDERITTTSDYEVIKKGDIVINDINEIAYTKTDRKLLESIMPYSMEEAKDFEVFYLNGFFSETYDISKEEIRPIIDKRIEQYKESLVKNILSPYERYNIRRNKIEELGNEWIYALLPTWMLTYNYNNKVYIYAMNGQTGKTFGELPIDMKKVQKDAIVTGIIALILALLGGYFIW